MALLPNFHCAGYRHKAILTCLQRSETNLHCVQMGTQTIFTQYTNDFTHYCFCLCYIRFLKILMITCSYLYTLNSKEWFILVAFICHLPSVCLYFLRYIACSIPFRSPKPLLYRLSEALQIFWTKLITTSHPYCSLSLYSI